MDVDTSRPLPALPVSPLPVSPPPRLALPLALPLYETPVSRFSEDIDSPRRESMPPPVPPKDDAVSVSSSWVSGRQSYVSTTSSSWQKPIKHGKGRHSRVELIPQPSDDPRDPLNWPQWRKELNYFSLLFIVGLIGGMKAVFITVNASLAATFAVSYASIAALTGVPLMLSAFSGHASLVASKLYGKRPVYLLSFVLIFIGSIWNMATPTSFSASMAARVFQGLGWGAFDTLVVGSIHDTFFAHERTFRLSIYHVLVVATTWGGPILGGVATRNAGSFTVQFRIINAFYLVVIPLLAFGVPETAFDRSSASPAPSAPSSPVDGPAAGNQQPAAGIQQPASAWLPSKAAVLAYLDQMRPFSYRPDVTSSLILQGPRALATPTVGLIFLLSFIPYSAIWSVAVSLALLLTSAPLSFSTATVGLLFTGPWVLSTLIVVVFSAYRPFHNRFSPLINAIVTGVGAALFLTGLLAFGLHVHDVVGRGAQIARQQLDPAVLSLLAGIVAAGLYTLDAATQPLIERSVSFTCSTMTVAQRCAADMHAGVVVTRNFVAAIFIILIPNAVSTLEGLKGTAIGLSVTSMFLTAGVAVCYWRFDDSIRRADGQMMGLVDLSLFKDVEAA
jgi:MFS family permease